MFTTQQVKRAEDVRQHPEVRVGTELILLSEWTGERSALQGRYDYTHSTCKSEKFLGLFLDP